MREVLVNSTFEDKHSHKKLEGGKTYPMTDARIAEIKEVNPNLITVLGESKEKSPEGELQELKKVHKATEEEFEKVTAELEATKKELDSTKAELEKVTAELDAAKKTAKKNTKKPEKGSEE